jgi:hypothetical protein
MYCVIYHNQLIGLYTCITDASTVAKQLHGSVIQECEPNYESDIGARMLQHPASSTARAACASMYAASVVCRCSAARTIPTARTASTARAVAAACVVARLLQNLSIQCPQL